MKWGEQIELYAEWELLTENIYFRKMEIHKVAQVRFIIGNKSLFDHVGSLACKERMLDMDVLIGVAESLPTSV